MNLIYHEFIKLIRQKSFIFLFIILLIVDISFIFIYQNVNDPKHQISFVSTKIEEQLSIIPKEERLAWLIMEEAFYKKAVEYELNTTLEVKDIRLDDEEYNRYKMENKELFPVYQNVLLTKRNYYEKVENYPMYVSDIEERTEEIRNGPLWDSYSKQEQKKILQQANIYRNLQNQKIDVVNYQGIENFATISIIKLLSILLMCGIVILIYKDDNNEIKDLLYATKYGQKITGINKIIFTFLMSFACTVLFIAIDYLVYTCIYGNCPMDVAMQSIPCLYAVPYEYTIGQWLLLSSVVFAFSIGLLSIFFCMLNQIFSSKIGSVFLFLFIILEACLYFLIDENSILSFFSTVNIIRIFDGVSLYEGIYPLYFEILSLPVSVYILLFLLMIGIVSFSIYLWFYGKPCLTESFHSLSITFKTTNLFLQESFLVLWKNKGVFVLIIIFISTAFLFTRNYINTTNIRKEQQIVYEAYAPYLGEMDDAKEMMLKQELETYGKIPIKTENLKKEYRNKKVSYDEYRKKEEQLKQENKHGQIICEIYERWQLYPSYISYGKGYTALFAFNQINRDILDTLLIIIAIAILLSGVYDECDKGDLFGTTKMGEKKRLYAKCKNAFLWSGVAFFIIQGFSILHFYILYPMQQLQAPLGSIHPNVITLTYPISADMTVLQYLCMLDITRIFGFISICILSLFVSNRCKNRTLSFTIIVTILLLPILLYMGNIEVVKFFSLFDLVMGNLFLQKTFSIFKFILWIGLDSFMLYSLCKKR